MHALGGQRGQALLEEVHSHALVVHFDALDPRLIGREGLQGPEVARPLRDDGVARVTEGAPQEVERLLRAIGEDDVVGIGGNALLGKNFDHRLAHLDAPIGATILQGFQPLLRDATLGALGHLVER